MIVELSINLSLLLIDAWLLPFRSMKREEKKKKTVAPQAVQASAVRSSCEIRVM